MADGMALLRITHDKTWSLADGLHKESVFLNTIEGLKGASSILLVLDLQVHVFVIDV